MRVLVTGGAGFIGANFVLRMARTRPDWQVTVLDALTYAGNGASLDPVADPIRFVQGSVVDADLVDGLVGDADCGAPRGREPQRQLAVRAVAVRRDQHRRHLPAPRGGAPARRTAAPRLHRRGLRRPRARRPRPVHRVHAGQPLLAVQRDEGLGRPAGAGLDPQLRHRGDAVELLQQLRPAAARREVHPAPDHRDPAGREAQALRHRENVRDWIHVDDHNDAVVAIIEQGRPGRPT